MHRSVQDAIRDRKTRFVFMGEEIRLISTVGLFITMNPGYAGRSGEATALVIHFNKEIWKNVKHF